MPDTTSPNHTGCTPDDPYLFEAVDWAAGVLSSCGIDDARIDAEVLLGFITGCDRAELYARFREKLDPAHWHSYQTLVHRRARREPLAYITGIREFMSLEFEVSRDVLIPRPETEVLAEFAIKFLQERVGEDAAAPQTVLDIGTGSGCLAVTIAKHVPEAVVYASDISEAALAVAARNARRHGVEGRIRLRCGDMYEAFVQDELQGKVNLIVSNPPYVSHAELDELQPEIRDFEPEFAYFAGEENLAFHRLLVEKGGGFLADSGVMCIEVGFGQAANVREIMLSDGRYAVVDTLIDAAGIERAVVARVNR
jgi:release factor glutamine methyltransferase